MEQRVAEQLRQAIGVDSATLGKSTLARAIRARRNARGMSTPLQADYATLLSHSPEELALLVEEVVVPETWFFRDAEAYSTLVGFVREQWGPVHPGERLKLLSAPCSTGEEPYSLAIALLESGWPVDRLRIDALDISSVALERAERGIYGRNSFRGALPRWVDRYFEKHPEGYSIRNELRRCVHFQQGNLVGDPAPPLLPGYAAILCRNVLIYFADEMQMKALLALERLLAHDGLLIVGAAEAFLTRCAGFPSAGRYASAFHSRRRAPHLTAKVLDWQPPNGIELATARHRLSAAALPQPAPFSAQLTAPLPLAASRALDLPAIARATEEGDLEKALAACEAHVREPREATAEAYCLLGVIREKLSRTAEAEEAYRRALYLDPRHTESLGHLALLVEQRGDPAGAERLRARARRSLQTTPA